MRAPGAARWAALVFLLAVAAWLATPAVPWLDDAFISLHSAQSVLAGGDPQYGSPPLAGVTSPPYVLLLITLLAAGLGPLPALEAAGALGLAALALALWWLGRCLGLGSWRQLALPAGVLAAGQVVDQATNGVETGWAMAVATVLVAAAVVRTPLIAAVAAGTLPWLRPDLAPLAGLMLLAALWQHPPRLRFQAAAIAAMAFLPWALWVYGDTGAWIPQTMAAKTAYFAEACRPLPLKVQAVGGAVAGYSALLLPASLLGLAFAFTSPHGRLALVAAAVTMGAYVVLLPGGLWHNYYRYLYPMLLPAVALGIGVSLKRPEFVWRIAAAAAIAITIVSWPFKRLPDAGESRERLDAAAWIRDHVEPDATLLVQDAGVFSVLTPNPLVDLVGLKTPASAAVHQRVTLPSCGENRGRAVAEIARASGADYVIVSATWDQLFALTEGLQQNGVAIELLRTSRTALEGYNVYRMRF
jgi:hypothetical protein